MSWSRPVLAIGALCATLATAPAFGEPSIGSAVSAFATKSSRPVTFLATEVQLARIRLTAPDPAAIDALKAANARARTKRLEVGIGRDLPASELAAASARWTPVAEGHVARWSVTSDGARSLRVALRATEWPDTAELRFAGNAQSTLVYGPYAGADAQSAGAGYWSPVLEGDTATVEVFVPYGAGLPDVAIDRISHLFVSFADPKADLAAKAAAACSVNLVCRAAVDAALAETGRSVARISFVNANGDSALCTGTLLNSTGGAQTPYFATAGHCIATRSEAASVTTRWFYETAACSGTTLNTADTQVGGGAVLLYANESEDFSFMRLNGTPPAGAVFSGWDSARLNPGQPMTGVHHPDGDVKKVSLGTAAGVGKSVVADGDGFRIQWSSTATGFTEPGSSGSGIFSGTAAAGYRFRGTLQGGPLVGCSSQLVDLYDYYSRFDLAFPFVAQYLSPASAPAPGPNALANPSFEGVASWTQASTSGAALLTNDPSLARTGSGYAWLGGVDSATDTLSQVLTIPAGAARLQLWYRIATAETTTTQRFDVLTISIVDAASGAVLMDVGSLSNLDRTNGYVESPLYDVSAFGNRSVRLQLRSESDGSLSTSFRIDDLALTGTTAPAGNQTALWYNAAESGWGINVSHQGDTAFATLFTYDASGAPMWLVMPAGARRQGANTFMGALYRTTGPAFNANPFTPIGAANITEVGDLTLDFNAGGALLGYRYDDAYVSKVIDKQVFGAAPATCNGTAGSRAGATNYQDLWWNPSESGWGLNVTHQGNTLFATLFTYAAAGQGLWLVLPAGLRQADGSFLGELYRTTGPAFNAVPFTPIGAGNITQVGTMRLRFQNGETGTLEYSVDGANVSKAIFRQVFGSPAPLCSG
jgi:lysyl endopeptidase